MDSSTEKHTSMNPKDLRFTQLDIGSTFTDRKYPSVTESVPLIQRGELDPAVYGELTVYRDEQGVVWCENNRRLYVLRMAGVPSVRVNFIKSGFTVNKLNEDKKKVNDPAFMPKIRGEKSAGPSPSPPISSQTKISLLGVLGAVCTALVAAYWGWKLYYAPLNNHDN
ncbi:hypothetical protein SUGI_0092210 [Cryptomeria japonica]|nr:hypothetical protein SUGI_0092210 [Cryptomeria japonica]